MSNYFTNLLDRHQQEGPVIKPRLPSLFESGTPASDLESVTPSSRDGSDVRVREVYAETLPEKLPVRSRVKRQEPTLVDFSVEEEKPKEGKEINLPPARQPVPQREISQQPQLLIQPSPLLVEAQPVLKPRISSADTIRQTASVAPRESVVAPLFRQETTRQSFAQDMRKPAVELESAVVHPEKPNVPKRIDKADVSPRQEPLLELKAVQLEQKILPAERTGIMTPPVVPTLAMPEKPAPKPEPIINVTIGRIEVRATTAPAPKPAKPHSAPATMSLDEYLRQRSKGERR